MCWVPHTDTSQRWCIPGWCATSCPGWFIQGMPATLSLASPSLHCGSHEWGSSRAGLGAPRVLKPVSSPGGSLRYG